MPAYGIDDWEKEQAELEIRKWLIQIGQWAPDVPLERLQRQETEEAALGELSAAQIDDLLRTEVVGRIGCCVQNKVYVVPIVFAYDGACIYGHSGDGLKVQIMRENPDVCFEVDHIESMTNWQSVIAWGRFEELHGDAAEQAMKLLIERIKPLMAATSATPSHQQRLVAAVSDRAPVLYRIVLTSRTGRYQQQEAGLP